MRKYIKIVEGEVVDFAARKQQADLPSQSQDAKYRGAGAYQASGLGDKLKKDNPFHQHIASHIQDVFTHYAAVGGPTELSPELAKRNDDILKVINMSAKISLHHAVFQIVQAYNDKFPQERINLRYADQASAYRRDDDSYLVNAIYPWGGNKPLKTFPNVIDLYSYVLGEILPKVPEAKKTDEVETLGRHLETLMGNKSAYDKLDPFDPHAVGEYERLSPHVEKILDRVGPGSGSISYLYQTDENGQPVLEINTTTGKRTMVFPDYPTLEQWVRKSEEALIAWHDRRKNRGVKSGALIRQITKEVVAGIQAVLTNSEIPKRIANYDLDSLVYQMRDQTGNKALKELFDSIIMDIRSEVMRKHLTPGHVQWLVNRVKELSK